MALSLPRSSRLGRLVQLLVGLILQVRELLAFSRRRDLMIEVVSQLAPMRQGEG
ncbi:hypothetical protein [Halomonas ramblicola]|uniref:hypothetical protein n=1 Tax=Halomonas ramblicola TaxID=747349 RepID=UPI0025B3E547|nr:hypothetical protein [Halomonas ramblicola]MDN3521508.1 hypothetical protein [Halomonas ramblicola]